jgi:hypothetical protein
MLAAGTPHGINSVTARMSPSHYGRKSKAKCSCAKRAVSMASEPLHFETDWALDFRRLDDQNSSIAIGARDPVLGHL